ncbi:hypothetical protein ACW7EJ_06490, partial [Acinetobacter soli]
TFISTTPSSVFSDFTALPIQIFNWTSRPQAEFQNLAAAGIIVLMTMLIIMNSAAIYIRNKRNSILTERSASCDATMTIGRLINPSVNAPAIIELPSSMTRTKIVNPSNPKTI